MMSLNSRSPRGERGLKFVGARVGMTITASLPSRGAWIEISVFWNSARKEGRSPRGERGLKSN